jgi:hypothetical protein
MGNINIIKILYFFCQLFFSGLKGNVKRKDEMQELQLEALLAMMSLLK